MTVTSLGLPVAPVAVTRIVPVRLSVEPFEVNEAVIVPLLVPDEPEEIESHAEPDTTEVVQPIVPVPVFETAKVVVPDGEDTERLSGATASIGWVDVPAWVTVTSLGLPVAPVAVTRIVPVRLSAKPFEMNEAVIVPLLVPDEPEEIESHAEPDTTEVVQPIVPVPVFETAKVVVPDSDDTERPSGVTANIGWVAVPAWVTVTSLGLPVAPVAVTRIVPVRLSVDPFEVNEAVIVPLLVPDEPEEIESHAEPDTTVAVQFIVPVPVFETEKVVVPDGEDTERLSGATASIGCVAVPAWVTVTSLGLPVAPVAVTRIVPVRLSVEPFEVNEAVIVPLLVPDAPDEIESHAEPDTTEAVQPIVPVPVFETAKVVVLAIAVTSLLLGTTDNTEPLL